MEQSPAHHINKQTNKVGHCEIYVFQIKTLYIKMASPSTESESSADESDFDMPDMEALNIDPYR